jgi:phospholipase C
VPAIIISPFVKRGFVDHTVYETASILAFIEHRFGLAPLNARDAAAQDFSAAFNF